MSNTLDYYTEITSSNIFTYYIIARFKQYIQYNFPFHMDMSANELQLS